MFVVANSANVTEYDTLHIIRQIGHCIGGNFNIHTWTWSVSQSVQVGRL